MLFLANFDPCILILLQLKFGCPIQESFLICGFLALIPVLKSSLKSYLISMLYLQFQFVTHQLYVINLIILILFIVIIHILKKIWKVLKENTESILHVLVGCKIISTKAPKISFPMESLTYSPVCISAGELYGTIMCTAWVFLILLVPTLSNIPEGQAIVHQIYLQHLGHI